MNQASKPLQGVLKTESDVGFGPGCIILWRWQRTRHETIPLWPIKANHLPWYYYPLLSLLFWLVQQMSCCFWP